MQRAMARTDLEGESDIKVPSSKDVPWPRFIPKRSVSSVSFSSEESCENLDIVLGPRTRLPGRLGTARGLRMSRRSILSLANCSSTEKVIRFSDYLRLSSRPHGEQPDLSFGSALHVGDGTNAMCLVCSAQVAFSVAPF